MLERDEVKSLALERTRRHRGQGPDVIQHLIKPQQHRSIAIADVLRHRPKGIKDTDIARAFGVSKQRIHQIKQTVRT